LQQEKTGEKWEIFKNKNAQPTTAVLVRLLKYVEIHVYFFARTFILEEVIGYEVANLAKPRTVTRYFRNREYSTI
jgi:hypothetical protein